MGLGCCEHFKLLIIIMVLLLSTDDLKDKDESRHVVKCLELRVVYPCYPCRLSDRAQD